MANDWFRNTEWNESIERAFDEKIARARKWNQSQYLRIQACTLASTHPAVALRLLDRYFAMPDQCDRAQAHVDRATALLALDCVSDAIMSYEAALAHEAAHRNSLTQAYLQLPYLVATRRICERYDRALEILHTHVDQLTFPVEHFLWHSANALIVGNRGDTDLACIHAEQALQAAALKHSGFSRHKSIGLVTSEYDGVIKELEAYRYGF